LTASPLVVEDGVHGNMKYLQFRMGTILVTCSFVATLAFAAQDPPAPKPPAQASEPARLTIEVSGGETLAPVENASVYVKYIEQRTLRKDKKVELNVKTNREGVAHVPDAPLGRALVQVIADGWKTYGRWYDITDPHQVIKIHLEKPPKWY
jgi:hypothetical protein